MWKRRNVEFLYAVEVSSYQLKRDCYIYKIYYVSLIAITKKKKSTIDTQKIQIKELKDITTKYK